MYVQPDDFEVGMLLIGVVETFHHEVVGDAITTVSTQEWRHANKVYRIKAIQLPYIVVEMAWNEHMLLCGKTEMIDTRYFHFLPATPEMMAALKIK